ncbi:DUF3577 domain-containing protein [Pseudorhodoferax sp. LjRoot39]|uniref:DUF3577 domain-containing protein n=1 Tax=Pseudorhodoferax sp. LjRoot39 TaxID=3342328 RepID=UPI003F4F6F90
MANQAQAQAQTQSEYFNLHVSGVGYLSRVRWVGNNSRSGGRRSEPFLSCAINALRGSSDDPQYTYFDLKVNGSDAIEIIRNLEKAANEGRKVIVSFKAGDIYVHQYDRQVRDAQGGQSNKTEKAALVKGRLILINTAKVDGELVYRREREEPGAGGEDGDSHATSHAGPDQEEPARARQEDRYEDREEERQQGRPHSRNFVSEPRRERRWSRSTRG